MTNGWGSEKSGRCWVAINLFALLMLYPEAVQPRRPEEHYRAHFACRTSRASHAIIVQRSAPHARARVPPVSARRSSPGLRIR